MRIVATHRIESQHAEVLAWHERPGALVRLTPPGVATIDDPTAGGMRAGRVVGAHMGPTALPLRPAWVLRHTDADPSGRFVDQQVSGPWRTWRHEHTIAPDPADPAASRLTDAIEIELPAGLERNAPVRAALERRVQRLLAFRARQVRDDLALHAGLAAIGPRTVAITGSSGLVGTQLAAAWAPVRSAGTRATAPSTPPTSRAWTPSCTSAAVRSRPAGPRAPGARSASPACRAPR